MDIRALRNNPSKSTNRKECKHPVIIYGEIGKQQIIGIQLACEGSIYTKRIQLIVNLIHRRGQLKVTFHFQHWHPGFETTLRKESQFEGIPTTVLSKTGHMFSTFLLCSKDSLESLVHIVFCTKHPVFIFTLKSAV